MPFLIPQGVHYLAGHSLGPLSKKALSFTKGALQAWEREGIQAWESAAWLALPFTVAAKIARLVGARAEEVIVTDSTSVNLYKVLFAALRLNPKRKILLTEEGNFPTDLYIAQGIAKYDSSVSLQCVKRDLIRESLSEKVAVLFLSHVNYRDSSLHDLADITRLAQQQGIIVVWDLSHSVGMVPLNLNEHGVDFAVGCTYKYLNGGPGSPSFIYVNKKHHPHLQSPIQGWMGHASPFSFAERFISKKDPSVFLAGTPSILSMKALDGALSHFDNIEIQTLRQKNLDLSEKLMDFVKQNIPELQCRSPEALYRGGHIAFEHPNAAALTRRLNQQGIICDYRANLIRLSLSPLYISETQIEKIAQLLKENTLCNP